ncbi:SLC45 family MFS transporter [Lentilactobacillus sp. SPB1-3]|uniref:SLC45 family MFS transporter n=1 Tax=Lentilactobacillus terminaliae TaxID=3003483 RepID=A0ACD5DFW1_9LACO|nr:SLC45 family MFS transporter [Lentilactobacillus sp. SPB1-3]MCZ0976453.1 SLC45 family MFS transporter [Lentilactobacillus sp. SPB1-3]
MINNKVSDGKVGSSTVQVEPAAHKLPQLRLSTIFALTFGFFGVNMAFSLQSSQMGRIFQTLGANPNNLGWFFIMPPLAGMIIQPLIGKYSDKTWTKFGRRMPYLLISGPIGAIVLILLPNAGSFGFGYGSLAALMFGAVATLFMDLTSNACMQPYKMIIGDMVNEDQKDMAWSWQQSFSNLGGVVATIAPFLLTLFGVANTAPKGEVPLTVKISYYAAAIILLLSSMYTVFSVHEYDPVKYAEYHGLDPEEEKTKTPGFIELLKTAPKSFWEIAVVQFFEWFAIMYLWTYSTGAIAKNVWNTVDASSAGYQAAGNWYGVLFCIQSVSSVFFGILLAKSRPDQRKLWYKVGALVGAVGFISIFFIHSQWLLIISFILIGVNNLTMNTQPFSLLTESLDGKNEGAYLGLFNCSICLPQIVASLASFAIFPLVGHNMPAMLLVAGISLIFAALSVNLIHSSFDKKSVEED